MILNEANLLPLYIVISIISVLLFSFLLIEIIGYFSLKKLNDRIEKRNYNVNILLAQKYDILVLLAKVFKKYNMAIPSEFQEELSPKMDESLKRLTLTERLTVKAYLMKASQTLLYFAESNEKVKNDNEYQILKKSLLEIDQNHRKALALYNADALGFNYWIKVWAFRPIARLANFSEKEIVPYDSNAERHYSNYFQQPDFYVIFQF